MKSQPLAVVVLAAGLGKRTASQQNRVLDRLAGLPLAAHVLRAVAPLNPASTVLVAGQDAARVRDTLGDSYGPNNSLPIEYTEHAGQPDAARALLMAHLTLKEYQGQLLVVDAESPMLRTSTLRSLLARHSQVGAHVAMLTCIATDPTGYGRVVRDPEQKLLDVVEERAATLVQRAISEVDGGVYVFESVWLWPCVNRLEQSAQKDYYLSDLASMAIKEGPGPSHDPARRSTGVVTYTLDGLDEAMSIKSLSQLAEAETIVQSRLREQWMYAGVTMFLPDTVYLAVDVNIGPDTVLYPGVILEGRTSIGAGCVIGPGAHIIDSTIGEGCRIKSATIEGSTLPPGTVVPPYTHIQPGSTEKS